MIDTNLDSLFNMTKQVVDDMVERGWGRIINISSVNGEKGQFGQTNYSAAKAGMHGFTMALAQEVANKGVTVNTVCPGYIGTEMVKAIRQEVLDKIVATHPGQAPGQAGGDRLDRRRGSRRTSRASPPAPTSRSTAACTWAEAPGAPVRFQASSRPAASAGAKPRNAATRVDAPRARESRAARRELLPIRCPLPAVRWPQRSVGRMRFEAHRCVHRLASAKSLIPSTEAVQPLVKSMSETTQAQRRAADSDGRAPDMGHGLGSQKSSAPGEAGRRARSREGSCGRSSCRR